MKIGLIYGYKPSTTAVYIERALRDKHDVIYLGPASSERKAYSFNKGLDGLPQTLLSSLDLLLYVDSPGRFFPRGLETVTCPTACYLIDVHRNLASRLSYSPFFDYIFVAQCDYVKHFSQAGHTRTYWLPLACDPEIHRGKERPKVWDVGFVGHINSNHRAHHLRLLAERYKVNDYQRFYPKEEIREIYSSSKIVFNSSIGGDLNMRVFEGMASGALLITDRIENGQRILFQPNIHLVEYSNSEELLDVVDYFLSRDSERERIAQAGRELVLSNHTYAARCQQLLETVFATKKPQLSAYVRAWDEESRIKAYGDLYYQKRMIEPLIQLISESRDNRQTQWRILRAVTSVLIRRLFRAIS